MSLIAMFWGLGAVLGPVIGGAFAVSSATWRWAFYINLVRNRSASIDLVVLVLGAGVWVSFLLAFTMAGTEWPWKDGRTIATFVIFGVVLLLYVLQQYLAVFTSPARRAFPGHLLRDRTQVLLYIATAAGTTALDVVFVNNDAALMAAVRLLPFIIIAVAVKLVSESLLHFIKLYKVIYIIASIFLVAGGDPLMAYLDTTTTTGTIYGLKIVVAVGTGLSMVTGYTVATLTTKPEDTGPGLSLQKVSQIGGQVIALAVASQIYQEVAIKNLSTVLAGNVYSQQEINSAVAGAQSTLFDNFSGELRDKALVAITDAMQTTFVMISIAGAVMLIAAPCMKREAVWPCHRCRRLVKVNPIRTSFIVWEDQGSLITGPAAVIQNPSPI
ncbi:MFS transporter [Penicillium sp. IBT 35674x]|nr:MFS transporter [Penicillium sp. IBT 35674x]